MAGEQQVTEITIPASADLSKFQYHAVWMRSDGSAGTWPAAHGTAGTPAFGILTNKPSAAGQGARVAVGGVAKMIANLAIAAGDIVMTGGGSGCGTSIAPTSAAVGYVIGIAKTRAAASGDMFEVLLDKYWVQR